MRIDFFVFWYSGAAAAAALVPRVPTAEGRPFLQQKKSRSYTLPPQAGLGPVKLRHSPAPSPSMEPDRADSNLLSLEEFLALANETPNRVSKYNIVHVYCMYV